MGQPKQLLEYRGEPLIQRAVRAALATTCRPVIVVLGAEAGRIREAVPRDEEVVIVDNPDWPLGMSTSLKKGLEESEARDPELEGILFMVVDQPYLTPDMLTQLLERFHSGRSRIVAARYGEVAGVPALIPRRFFRDLKRLRGDKGARALFKAFPEALDTIPFPEGGFDIDTPSDYDRLREEE